MTTAHEFAKAILEMPDRPLRVMNQDGCLYEAAGIGEAADGSYTTLHIYRQEKDDA